MHAREGEGRLESALWPLARTFLIQIVKSLMRQNKHQPDSWWQCDEYNSRDIVWLVSVKMVVIICSKAVDINRDRKRS